MSMKAIRYTQVQKSLLSRCFSDSTKNGKRYLQTIPSSNSGSDSYIPLNYAIDYKQSSEKDGSDISSIWLKHSLPTNVEEKSTAPVRRSRVKKLASQSQAQQSSQLQTQSVLSVDKSAVKPAQSVTEQFTKEATTSAASTGASTSTVKSTKKPRRTLRPRKALITLSANAISHLKDLSNQPDPKLIRIGVKNRGCSGLSYDLEYVTAPGKFDELIEQDGVKVLIDSKAIFSIVGSEMDWIDDKLASKFIFKNPNSKGTCGCGESFMV